MAVAWLRAVVEGLGSWDRRRPSFLFVRSLMLDEKCAPASLISDSVNECFLVLFTVGFISEGGRFPFSFIEDMEPNCLPSPAVWVLRPWRPHTRCREIPGAFPTPEPG